MQFDQQFVQPQQYAQQASEMSGGAMPVNGMPSYPLYGLPPLGQTADETPFYRRPLVCFGAGAAVVGAVWAYFGWWRPRQAKLKKNED
jgi:hypothetical protein